MWRTKRTKVEQNSSCDVFGSMISVLVFQFQGVPLYIRLSALYGGEKKEGLGCRKNKENEFAKDHWRQEVQCQWKKEARAIKGSSPSDRVRRVKNKEYCAMTSSLHPLKLLPCLSNPNSGGVLTGKCLAFPVAHINTEWWWLRKWLHGNYITEWWGVK